MQWLADECVAAYVVDRLREVGHDVAYIAETGPSASDSELVVKASREQRILLTEDKDFGELVFRRQVVVPGVVLLRFEVAGRSRKRPQLAAAIEEFGDTLFGRYTAVEEGRFRARSLSR